MLHKENKHSEIICHIFFLVFSELVLVWSQVLDKLGIVLKLFISKEKTKTVKQFIYQQNTITPIFLREICVYIKHPCCSIMEKRCDKVELNELLHHGGGDMQSKQKSLDRVFRMVLSGHCHYYL